MIRSGEDQKCLNWEDLCVIHSISTVLYKECFSHSSQRFDCFICSRRTAASNKTSLQQLNVTTDPVVVLAGACKMSLLPNDDAPTPVSLLLTGFITGAIICIRKHTHTQTSLLVSGQTQTGSSYCLCRADEASAVIDFCLTFSHSRSEAGNEIFK